MTPDQAAWVRDVVLDTYLADGANQAHRWCRPQPPADGCQRDRPVCMLRAPRPYGPPDPRGGDRPDLYHAVWLAEPDPPLTWDAWIRANVWPAWMQAMDADYPGRGCFLMRMCTCQLGVCVPCSQDEPRHDRCLSRDREPYGWDVGVYSSTCIYGDADCAVVSHAHKIESVSVAGRSCRWRCPCGCWREPLAESPPKSEPVRKPRPVVTIAGQLDLFEFAEVG